jgi:hypothetical protein
MATTPEDGPDRTALVPDFNPYRTAAPPIDEVEDEEDLRGLPLPPCHVEAGEALDYRVSGREIRLRATPSVPALLAVFGVAWVLSLLGGAISPVFGALVFVAVGGLAGAAHQGRALLDRLRRRREGRRFTVETSAWPLVQGERVQVHLGLAPGPAVCDVTVSLMHGNQVVAVLAAADRTPEPTRPWSRVVEVTPPLHLPHSVESGPRWRIAARYTVGRHQVRRSHTVLVVPPRARASVPPRAALPALPPAGPVDISLDSSRVAPGGWISGWVRVSACPTGTTGAALVVLWARDGKAHVVHESALEADPADLPATIPFAIRLPILPTTRTGVVWCVRVRLRSPTGRREDHVTDARFSLDLD